MTSFFYIFIIVFILGQIHIPFRNKKKQDFVEFLMGIIAVMVARLYIHTGLSMLIAGISIILAYKWPMVYRFRKEYSIQYVLLGVFLAAIPSIGFLMICIFLIFSLLTKDYLRSLLLSSFILPWIMILTKSPDSFIILGFFSFMIMLLEWIEYETEEVKTRFIKISRKGIYKGLSIVSV